MSPEYATAPVRTLTEALIAGADPELWAQYCRLAADLAGRSSVEPVPAPGSVEWQRQQDRPMPAAEPVAIAAAIDAGRRRLSQRGAPPPFAGAPSPFGAAGSEAFAEFLAHHRGPAPLLAEIDAIEFRLVSAFEADLRSGRFRASGLRDSGRTEAVTDWFGRVRLDFARNAIVFPDGSVLAGIEVTIGPNATAGPPATGAHRQRPAQVMLRQALAALWERGAFSAGTGNERVLALVLRELGLSAADPPYGLKSAETVRKLRKALKMSL